MLHPSLHCSQIVKKMQDSWLDPREGSEMQKHLCQPQLSCIFSGKCRWNHSSCHFFLSCSSPLHKLQDVWETWKGCLLKLFHLTWTRDQGGKRWAQSDNFLCHSRRCVGCFHPPGSKSKHWSIVSSLLWVPFHHLDTKGLQQMFNCSVFLNTYFLFAQITIFTQICALGMINLVLLDFITSFYCLVW